MEKKFCDSRYSDKLVSEMQAYMKSHCGLDISCDEAELYLDSLANLYGCFITTLEEVAWWESMEVAEVPFCEYAE